MKEIIKLILNYHFTIIFVILEIIAFSLIVLHNNYQRTVFSGYAMSSLGTISATVTNVDDYFCLKETNDNLVAENTILKNLIEQLKSIHQHLPTDSLSHQSDSTSVNYIFETASMLNASINKTKNYITINKGKVDGLQADMAVCSSEGVVGMIEEVSEHYAKVLPLININLRISAKIQKNGYYGSLQWDGNDYRYSYLNDIPFHVKVELGDTIVTSSFSSIFPEGELIGFVESINKESTSFLQIKVKLATDFKKISDMYVIAYTKKEEQQQLEEESYE